MGALAPYQARSAGTTKPAAADVEPAVRAKAKELFSLIADYKTSPLSSERWQAEMMDWAMADERLKVELFRFVDVFPTLHSAAEIDRHLREYFEQPGLETPRLLRMGLAASRRRAVSPVATTVIRRQMLSFAQRFIFGRDAAAALPKLRELRDKGLGFTLDVLGEASVGEREAVDYQQRYLELLDGLQREVGAWRPDRVIDQAAWGPVPRVNISIKVTSLYSQIDPLNYRCSVEAVKDRLRPILRKAQATGAFVNLDLEQFRYRDLTLAVFKELLDESEFAGYDEAGIVVQAYLRDAEDDLHGLIDWARDRDRVVTVRLVKGAYWDYETVQAAQEGWPAPVFTQKPDSDVMYERLTRLMLANPAQIRPAFASHNVRSLANAIATAEAFGLPRDAYELQMLHGMGEPIKRAVKTLGLRLREYAPVGELIPGMAYFVRRLLENTANESFLRLTFVDGEDQDRLVRAPQPSPSVDRAPQRLPESAPTDASFPGEFVNHPHADYARPENVAAFAAALERVGSGESEAGLGRHWPLWIGGEGVEASETLTSVNPARPEQVVGTAGYAGEAEAERAVAAARSAFETWSATPPAERAAVLFRAAEQMRAEFFDLAALEVYEAGKTWREADADVGEAVDFLEYYGREILRLEGEGRLESPVPRGEGRPGSSPPQDGDRRSPLGVALVVAPWNFPLAILTGMTSAALVTGNTVIVKPAGPTPVIAAQLARILHAAGAPAGTVNYLPSPGGSVGAALVRHPDVELIAFTGSKEVGLHIIEQAAAHPSRRGLKRVIAEMGGKNALIVDSDADLDVAVLEGIASAFHFQGQKCSATSRIVVLESAYDEFLARFVDAARSVVIGPPDDPASRMGPVITAEAKATIEAYIEQGKREGRPVLVTEPPTGGWPEGGFYVGPHIFADVDPGAVIAQEEIFGPVVAVMKARDMDEALAIANGTQYALTGGLISRSPATIARIRREFLVGNLYINRGTTGALVERQAFGGFKMSGIGSKAGGPDYLAQFLGDGPLPADEAAAPALATPATATGASPQALEGTRPQPAAAGEPELKAAHAVIGRAAAAAGILSRMSTDARAAAVSRAARLVRQNGRELQARLLAGAAPAGSDVVRWAAEEVARAAEDLDRIAALIREVDRVRRMGRQPGELNHYFYQPRGLVLALTSSRRPLTSACVMAGSALAAGDPVVVKPGSRAEEAGAYLTELLVRAGFPADAVGLVTGSGAALGAELVLHPDVDLVALTGSRAVALQVAEVAGRHEAGDRVKRVIADVDRPAPRRPDAAYLVQYLEPRVVTENTLRRGFVPPDELLEVAR
jgi:RHH-type proline utilization regulon transcriptional repressor/proline dehydrogenase/delta 1-pyrroline-5-carboxylate dehydrogenase